MISAQELRIGNLIQWEDDSNEIEEITGIYKKGDNDFVSFKSGAALLDEFIPVPLTEEWLLRFGFRKIHNAFGRPCYAIYVDDNLCIEAEENVIKVCLTTDHYEKETSDVGIRDFINMPVHQLQNLYFALTGKELELKEIPQ